MKLLPDWITKGYLRLIDPVANWLVKRGVHPNTITVIGTFCTLVGGIICNRPCASANEMSFRSIQVTSFYFPYGSPDLCK